MAEVDSIAVKKRVLAILAPARPQHAARAGAREQRLLLFGRLLNRRRRSLRRHFAGCDRHRHVVYDPANGGSEVLIEIVLW